MKPVVSVVIVNDYACGQTESWDFIRATLNGLAHQDFCEPAEFLYVESRELEHKIPTDLTNILKDLKVILSPANNAYQLKNVGVKAASADIIASLDADCVPNTDWLRNLVTALREHPEVSVATGRTMYEDQSLLIRTLCLLERSFVDPGHTGYTLFFEDNNAGYRRSVLLKYPYHEEKEAFVGGRCFIQSIRRAGHLIMFQPKMKVIHAFHGLRFERDLRRNCGRAYFITRCVDPSISFSWFVKLGYFSIPLFLFSLLVNDWIRCIKLGRRWNIRLYELPFAMCVSIAVRALEIPGFIDGIEGRAIKHTYYR